MVLKRSTARVDAVLERCAGPVAAAFLELGTARVDAVLLSHRAHELRSWC